MDAEDPVPLQGIKVEEAFVKVTKLTSTNRQMGLNPEHEVWPEILPHDVCCTTAGEQKVKVKSTCG